ncbi:hypothetical protein GCM10010112_67880 [Actinoplanes lobatus]|uniref:Uncharacterized protein n=1 Tax=Actinoplanes lobatus TaxID=113568 RepID=A0A7W7MG73_9ACTN|nr:hypothetical protein [Actinoplanes lobatus]MBB4749132.1 hypothetical protein [Actinoplanes lobatus]GGN86376.1 hypothetical protein GCM10010112_67880 [Actinoplanes lobatus]GIE42770.1 hypothetical protein Alo02nite_56680 [Actinoplanes lobatus]
MPRYVFGAGVNLEHTVYDRDGALTAGATVVFTATPATGSPVVPAVSTPSTGVYRAATFAPGSTGQWTYSVSVSGPVTDIVYGAFAVVDGSTLTTPPTGAYASQADLSNILSPLPDNADTLLIRAAREIDRALLCAVYDVENADVIAALKQASLEQIAGAQQDGDSTGLGGVTTTATNFTIGKIQVTKASGSTTPVPRTNGLVDQAWLTLQTAGLTGQGPGERWVNW